MAPSTLGIDRWALADLVQVRTEKPFGSGLLVGAGLVLTALHCVADPHNRWSVYQTIAVNLWRDLVGLEGAAPSGRSYRATVVWQPEIVGDAAPPDIVLLQLKVAQGDPVPSPKRVGPLLYADLGLNDTDVVATGFPALLTGGLLPGGRGEGAFSGVANLFQHSSPTISFTSRLIKSESGWESWSGLSGGPLFRGNAVVGIMRGGQPQFKTDRNLEAEPLGPLLRDPKCERLAQLLGAQDEAAGPISPRELVALKRLLAQERVAASAIRNAYLVSHVSATAPATDDPDLSARLIDDVAAHGAAAMRKFLARLVVDSPSAGQGIEEWVSRQPELGELQLAGSPIAAVSDDPVVLIKVIATAETVRAPTPRERTYVVEAWVFNGVAEASPVDPGQEIREIKHAMVKLPQIIQTFVTKSLGYLPTSTVPRVELALPLDLLGEAVERWLVKAGRVIQRPLGTTFPLALRSYDRLYDHELQNSWFHWRQGWQGLPARIGDSQLHWIDSLEAWGEQLYDAINGRPLVCVALTRGGSEGIGMLIEAGASIAIWLRDAPHDEAAARAAIRGLVCGLGVQELPATIQNQRRLQAAVAAWDGMALLYDDPNRLPPDAQARFQSV